MNSLITSAANPRLKHLAKLVQQRRARHDSGLAVLEGVHLLQTFIDAGHAVQALYVPQRRLADAEVVALRARLADEQVWVVADAALGRISSLAEADDVIGVVARPPAAPWPTTGDCVVLERVQDPGNVGAILRSAAAAGVGQALLGPDCADVWSPKVLRAGMGAHALLHIAADVDLAAWRAGYRDAVYATALYADSVSLYALDLRAPAAWLFGNEGSGLSAAMQAAGQTVHIPMATGSESLNVAMAASVCVFEQRRQRLAA